MSILFLLIASWVCPVMEGHLGSADDISGLGRALSVESWSGVIRPVQSELQFIGDSAGLEYSITETIEIDADADARPRFCIDLGTVSETRRVDVRAVLDGTVLVPCSCLAEPLYDLDEGLIYEGCFLVKYDSFLDSTVICKIADLEDYRNRFRSDEEFRSAVAGSGRSYVLQYELPLSQGPQELEVTYTVRGWSHVTGPEALDYSLFNVFLMAGNLGSATLRFDPGGTASVRDWSTSASSGGMLSGAWSVGFDFEEVPDPYSAPLYSISHSALETELSDAPAGTVYYASMPGTVEDIYMLRFPCGEPVCIASSDSRDHRPAVSRDGTRLLFVSERQGQPDLYQILLTGGDSSGSDPVRMTCNPDEEFDISWNGDSHVFRFSSCGTSDMERISFFYDPGTLDLESIWSIFGLDSSTGTIDRMSLEPGDYRFQCFTNHYGTVYARRRWDVPGDEFRTLGYFHGALANRSFERYLFESVSGPLRALDDSLLLVPCTDSGSRIHVWFDPVTETALDTIRTVLPGLYNVTPLGPSPDSCWYLGQTGMEGDSTSEIVLVYDPEGEARIVRLTDNDWYDGEASWTPAR